MRVLNVVTAASTWLFDIADLNPKGKSVFPEILEWIKDTYSFKEAPETAANLDENKGLTFKGGAFQAREEVFVDVQLTIFNDGVVARSSSSTEDTDRFLENVISSAVTEYSLTFDPSMVRRRIYLSELNVRLDKPLVSINPKLTAFADKLSAMCSNTAPTHFELGGISFWTDSTFAVTKTSPFLIERKANAPFNENRFYTKAPLQTEQHIVILAELEAILISP
jgi:hypothetical protein